MHKTPGHCRTPRYIRGKTGTIERCCGSFQNPEDLAYGNRATAPLPLYRVRFAQRDIWSEYAGAGADTLDVELYEHWLTSAEDSA
jgi:nitrile hydratase